MESNIRNFCIIAHIDSGKSTLADRFLEITGTVPKRQMQPQYLDKMELERERGITIKMAPVRMIYKINHAEIRNSNIEIPNKPQVSNSKDLEIRYSKLDIANSKQEFVLNLIDTPGHSDFSYEVSRALAAVEGAILLVDATKGVQAQTLSNLRAARRAGLKIIGAVNKIDLNLPHLESAMLATASLLGVGQEDIFKVSAKTGEGVNQLLEAVINKVPPPKAGITSYSPRSISGEAGQLPISNFGRALIFDSIYDDHKGIIAFARVFDGEFSSNKEMTLLVSGAKFKAKETGYFSPEFKPGEKINEGEIGYIATGIKEPEKVRVGDTIINLKSQSSNLKANVEPLPGYKEPAPVVFISFYPDGKTKFEDLKKGIERLRLSDPALNVEPEANEALGRGLKVGFLGQLHFEIISSRLQREFNLEFLTSFPTIAYRIKDRDTEKIINQPQDFPDKPEKVWQPIISLDILSPKEYLNSIASLKNTFDLNILEVETLGENILIKARMPLAELIRDFDDKLKSASAGYASFGYEISGEEEADVTKLDILIVGDVIPALTRIVPQKDAEREGRRTVERLKELLPKQQFTQSIQARANGRIIAREDIPAMRKDVTGYLYGGDRSRKMKLWKKQQRGKEKLKNMARVEISPETFREILKK